VRKRGAALATGAALIVLWSAIFAPQLFRGHIFTLGDAIAFRPFPEFSRARWHEHHERTFWNPYVLAGIPATVSLADSRPQYLPDLALDLYELVRAPFAHAVPMAAPLFAHLAGMLALAALARALWGVGPLGMIWAGAAWGLMPDLIVPLAFGHDAQCLTASLVPVMLLAIHRIAAADEARARLGAALLLALALGLTTLGGHPQILVYAAMLGAAFATERFVAYRRYERIAWLAGAVALGIAIGAAAWYPALRYSAHSSRGATDAAEALAEIARFSLGPGDLLSLVWPWAVGHSGAGYWGGLPSTEYPRYAGILVVAASVASWRGRRVGAGAAWVLAGAACFALVVSLGAHLGPIYGFLFRTLPFWSRFRVPAAAMIVAQLALALLSARLFAAPEPASPLGATPRPGATARPGAAPAAPTAARPAATAAAVAVALALLMGLALWLGPLAGTYAGAVRAARPALENAVALATAHHAGLDLTLRVVALLAGASLFVLRGGAGHRRPIAALALPLVLAADMGSVMLPILARSSGPATVLVSTPIPELAHIGAAEPHVRVASARPPVANAPGRAGLEPQAEFLINDWIRWRARALGGGHSAAPALWRAGGALLRSYAGLEALGVTYVSFAPGTGFDPTLFEKVRETPDEVVCRVRRALGRLFAVPRVEAAGNDVAMVEGMLVSGFDPRLITLSADAAAAGDYPGSVHCVLNWVEDEPDRVAFDAEAPDHAFVVIADTSFPGWSAEVDHQAAPLFRVNQLTRGVALPAGRHRVTMRYVPEGWSTTVPITRAAMLAWLLTALALVVWSRFAAGAPRPAS
jgi:hypothetical protein